MDKCSRKEFDLSSEVPCPQYFKSSFARSMAVDCMKQSKSLDNAFLDRPTRSEKRTQQQTENVWSSGSVNSSKSHNTMAGTTLCTGNKVMKNGSEVSNVFSVRKNNRSRNHQGTDPAKLWKIKQDDFNRNDTNTSGQQNPNNSYTELDVLRLRKECQSLVEENRRLQAALDLRSVPLLNGRSLQVIDSTILQSRVDTLQWQLKQAESSRQMYRAVMEQVVRFLERAYKNLDLIKTKMDPGGNANKSSPAARVPRSRSVHTVDVSPSRESSKSETPLNFPRAKSIAQIEASPNYSTFRDFTWRRPRQTRSDPEEVPPEKLSQEAFRLLRTAQSLLNTREPDLVQRLCPEIERESVPDHDSISSHRSSISSSIHAPEDDSLSFQCSRKREPISLSTGSCNSLLRQSLDAVSLHSLSCTNNNSSLTSGLESAFAGGCRASSPTSSQKCKTPSPPILESGYSTRGTINSSPPVPQLSVSSTEDESGFSSMNSFQEVGLPIVSPPPTPVYSQISSHSKQPFSEIPYQHNEGSMSQSKNFSGPGYQELGLPVVDLPPNGNNRGGPMPSHRRWSSSPAEAISHYSKHSASFCGTGETLRVLWV